MADEKSKNQSSGAESAAPKESPPKKSGAKLDGKGKEVVKAVFTQTFRSNRKKIAGKIVDLAISMGLDPLGNLADLLTRTLPTFASTATIITPDKGLIWNLVDDFMQDAAQDVREELEARKQGKTIKSEKVVVMQEEDDVEKEGTQHAHAEKKNEQQAGFVRLERVLGSDEELRDNYLLALPSLSESDTMTFLGIASKMSDEDVAAFLRVSPAVLAARIRGIPRETVSAKPTQLSYPELRAAIEKEAASNPNLKSSLEMLKSAYSQDKMRRFWRVVESRTKTLEDFRALMAFEPDELSDYLHLERKSADAKLGGIRETVDDSLVQSGAVGFFERMRQTMEQKTGVTLMPPKQNREEGEDR